MNPILDAALAYAGHGWHVFPVHGMFDGCCTCGRGDCSSRGKHPLTRNGLRDATTDEDVIRGWWRRWRRANVAIATGTISGVVVVDIDLGPRTNTSFGSLVEEEQGQEQEQKRKAAFASLHVITRKLPVTLTGLTGGGGLHLIYRARSDGEPVRNRTSGLPGITSELPGVDLRSTGERFARFARARNPKGTIPPLRNHTGSLPGHPGPLPGMDLRANGGYVIAPPSLHASGARYEWLDVGRLGRPYEVHDPDHRDEDAKADRDPFDPSDDLIRHDFTIPEVPIAPAPAWLRERPPRPIVMPSAPPSFSGDGTRIGLTVLREQIAILARAKEGERNHTLNRCAFIVARYVAAGQLLETAARSELTRVALSIGLTKWETDRTIDSAFKGAFENSQAGSG